MPRMSIKGVKHDGPVKRESIFDVLKVENEGASPRGSTFFKAAMGCPREWALTNVVGLRPEQPAEPLTVGWLYHHCLQLFYQAVMEHQKAGPHRPSDAEWLWGGETKGMSDAYAVLDQLDGVHGYGETEETARRLLDAYFETYSRTDKWRIIAVEETLFYHGVGDGGFEYSARLDLLVEDYDRTGMWIVEHKSARALTRDLLDNYQLDIQVLGQVWLLKECTDLDKLPPFKGVKVNIITKAKEPKTTRVEICPSPGHLRAFERSIGQQTALLPIYKELGYPQYLGHCAGYARGYSACQFYDLCQGHPGMTVADWTEADPPEGFIRNTEQNTE